MMARTITVYGPTLADPTLRLYSAAGVLAETIALGETHPGRYVGTLTAGAGTYVAVVMETIGEEDFVRGVFEGAVVSGADPESVVVRDTIGAVAGDIRGKVLGGGDGTITGTGVRAVDGSGNAIAPAATALTSATWNNDRAAALDHLDADVSSRAEPGDEMALTGAQVTALVAAIEAEIADDATGEAVKQAIIDKLIENLPDLEDLTLAAIAQAVWDRLLTAIATEGSIGKMLKDRIDATITSRHASGAAVAKSPATLAAEDVTGNLPANVLEWNGSSDAVAIINAGGQDRPAMALGLGAIGAGVFEANSIGASVLADSAVAKIQNGLALTGEAQTAVQPIQVKTDQLQFDAEGRVIALAQGVEIDEEAIAEAVDATLSESHGAGSWEGANAGTGPYVLTITTQDADETPIPNVRVRISQGPDVLSGPTDGDGVLVLRASNLGTYSLDAARDGYQQTSAGTVEVEGSAAVAVVMELSPTTSTPTTAIRFRPSGSGESSKVQSSPPFVVSEKTTAVLTFTLNDETGQAIPLADLDTLTLTLYDKATGDTINDRNEQDVLNANRVVVSSTGAVTWSLSPADNEIINPAVTSGTRDTGREKHVALFQWTWDDGEEASSVQIEINVRQVRGITSSSESSG